MKRLTVFVVPGSTAKSAILYKDRVKAERAMSSYSRGPQEETLVYDETKYNVGKLFSEEGIIEYCNDWTGLAYQAYNGKYMPDWYLSAAEAKDACSGESPWLIYEATLEG